MPVQLRVGGADRPSHMAETGRAGSAPRGRSGLSPRHPPGARLRFSSAWAERTVSRPSGRPVMTVQLRVGGADVQIAVGLFQSFGSAPRGRSGLIVHESGVPCQRFSSAWAERTSRFRPARSRGTVQLRVAERT
ncbi:hypothetical protein SLA_7106 [Streptomyces laurentii]|uniref:Uncharacterized protein n=1 Tax=Streptomyces laurentii TaxID=39478 RepID=A0A169PIG5_STRLU|nr:hypothetical protein SLA_7106 [Streptomyces laurentii]